MFTLKKILDNNVTYYGSKDNNVESISPSFNMLSPFLRLDTCVFYLAFTQKLRRNLEEEALKSRSGILREA